MSKSMPKRKCYARKILGKHCKEGWKEVCLHYKEPTLCCRQCPDLIKACKKSCARTHLNCIFFVTREDARRIRLAYIVDSKHAMFQEPEVWDEQVRNKTNGSS